MRKIAFDSKAITIDDERQLIISGAIHYPRSTPEMWPELMKRSKAAGLNTVETYVFWNLHEKKRGVLDFSGRLNLRKFCKEAQEQGMDVILRIGPYICAETNFGGLPHWLTEIEGLRTRTWNKLFMDEMERWVSAFCDYIQPLLAKNGGPVILAQFENEYANIGEGYGADGEKYVEWAVELGQNLDLGVPLIMCEGSAPGALETLNGFCVADRIEGHWREHPEQPAIWTENWPAWYNTWGYFDHYRTREEVAYELVRFFAAGGTGVNYYMWHGGTNFARETMYLQTTSYDFDAPLDEYGMETSKSRYVGKIHQFLIENQNVILNSERPTPVKVSDTSFVYELKYGDDCLTFLGNADRASGATISWQGVDYELNPQAIIVLKNGAVQLDTSCIDIEPVNVELEVLEGSLATFWEHPEPLPSEWPEPLYQPLVTEQPINQLPLTNDDTDYCWYSADIEIGEDQAGEGILSLDGAADFLYVYVDGVLQACTKMPLAENRSLDLGSEAIWTGPDHFLEGLKRMPECLQDSLYFRDKFTLNLTPGPHRLDILCTAIGLIKGDWMLGFNNMCFERKGIWGKVCWQDTEIKTEWRIQPGLVGESCSIFGASGCLVDWQQDASSGMRWLKTEFAKPAADLPLCLDLDGMNKGMIWLNGICVGRYWLVESTMRNPISPGAPVLARNEGKPTQRYYHIPKEWLRDTNTLVLLEENGGDSSKIQLCQRVAR